MAKIKKKLSASVKAAKREAKLERHKKYETVFMSGKQVRVKRPQLIEGMSVNEFISQNADAIWQHQNEMWEQIDDSLFDSSLKLNQKAKRDRKEFLTPPSHYSGTQYLDQYLRSNLAQNIG